jgi:hypothetical protein
LTEEIDAEPIQGEDADDQHCKANEEDERAMQEAMQKTNLSERDTSGIEDINDLIQKVMPTYIS